MARRGRGGGVSLRRGAVPTGRGAGQQVRRLDNKRQPGLPTASLRALQLRPAGRREVLEICAPNCNR